MATGTKLTTSYDEWFPLIGLSVSAPTGEPFYGGPYTAYDTVGAFKGFGSLTVNLPNDPVTYPDRTATKLTSFFEDFYNRIYITPVVIDFGAITSNATVTVDVWNAYFGQSVTLSSLTYDSSTGLGVAGPAVPKVILPLGTATYEVTALAAGPAMLSTNITWTFDTAYTFILPVVGSRVRGLGLAVAWPPSGQTYQIKYSFQTAIITSRSGKEQRIANRTTPRKNVTFQAVVKKEGYRAFKDQMWFWQHQSFAIREIPRFAVSSSDMSTGESSIELVSVPNWMAAGMQVLLYSATVEDIREVLTIVGNVVTFKTQSGAYWPVGTRVYAGLTGNLSTSVSAPRATNDVVKVAVDFAVAPLSEIYADPPAPSLMFNGREVFLKKPNWANPVDGSYKHDVDILDYARGPVSRFTPVAFGSDVRKATYLGKNFLEAELLLDLFRRMKGRQGEFYMPTWEYDFRPMVQQEIGTVSFRVDGSDFSRSYGQSTVHKAMFVQMRDGSVLLRKILSIDPVSDGLGDDSLITLETPWTAIISEDTVVMAGWLLVNRFVSDDLTFEWVTNTVANVQMNMMTLEDLPVETP